jgi:hypothetical protein
MILILLNILLKKELDIICPYEYLIMHTATTNIWKYTKENNLRTKCNK